MWKLWNLSYDTKIFPSYVFTFTKLFSWKWTYKVILHAYEVIWRYENKTKRIQTIWTIMCYTCLPLSYSSRRTPFMYITSISILKATVQKQSSEQSLPEVSLKKKTSRNPLWNSGKLFSINYFQSTSPYVVRSN